MASELPGPPAIDESRWFYRRLYMPFFEAVARYHRIERVAGEAPEGPCIFVMHHGLGYLSLDLIAAAYELSWRPWFNREGPRRSMHVAVAASPTANAFPGFSAIRGHFGVVTPSEEDCLGVLAAGGRLLLTPGGRREATPSAEPYALRWEGRYGFARLALKSGAPIVPLAVVGGHRAYPGKKLGPLSLWLPVGIPVRLRCAVGEPIAVPGDPALAQDEARVRELHALAWERTRALYASLIG